MTVLQVDSGGEKYVSFARKKLREWHQWMITTGVYMLDRVIDVSDGSRIYVSSLYLGNARFRDGIRITSGRTVLIDAEVVADIGAADIDVYTRALAKYPDAATFVGRYTVTVSADVTALTWDIGGLFPAGCAFVLVTVAHIYGRGGAGGGATLAFTGSDGAPGGDALSLNGKTVIIDNREGFIFGGGGGGGGGGGAEAGSGAGVAAQGSGGGGGGGAGPNDAAGGESDTYSLAATVGGPTLTDSVGTSTGTFGDATISAVSTAGSAGSVDGPGTGGIAAAGAFTASLGVSSGSFTSGTGGAGGNYGEAGSDGADGVASVLANGHAAGVGGAAGKAIALGGGEAVFDGFENGNTPERIKGAVT